MDDEPEVDKDEVVASIMGAKDPDAMSPAAQQYKDKIKEQIAKVCEIRGVCVVQQRLVLPSSSVLLQRVWFNSTTQTYHIMHVCRKLLSWKHKKKLVGKSSTLG